MIPEDDPDVIPFGTHDPARPPARLQRIVNHRSDALILLNDNDSHA
jgi:hypothetical protein